MGKDKVALAAVDGVPVRSRRVPKQDRSIESRAKALQGARAALEKFGFGQFTMRSVAAMSSVGVGTIYDYFPSKTAILRELLKERLSLRLQIFDDTIASVSRDITVSTFFDQYLQEISRNDLWSRFDVELLRAADSDEGLQELVDWHHEETVARYVQGLKAGGTLWPDEDLHAVAAYLISISSQFEPGIVTPTSARGKKLTAWLIKKTFLTIVRDVLKSPPR